jgi:phage-related protein
MGKIIKFYTKSDGKSPVLEFLDSLPSKVAQKVTWVLTIIEFHDNIQSNYFKKLTNTDLWECRIQFGSNIYRILCFFEGNSVIILTHGFIKKTQKTPIGEIEKAEQYMKDYLKRRK